MQASDRKLDTYALMLRIIDQNPQWRKRRDETSKDYGRRMIKLTRPLQATAFKRIDS